MSIDYKLKETGYGFDISIENGVIIEDSTLYSPIIVSLFQNARNPNVTNKTSIALRGGHWYTVISNREIGSLLWLELIGLTTNNIDTIQGTVHKSLEWLTREGLLDKVIPETSLDNDTKVLSIDIHTIGDSKERFSFQINNLSTYGI